MHSHRKPVRQSTKQTHLMLARQLENCFEHSVHIDSAGLRDLRCPGTQMCTSHHDLLETVVTMSASMCDTSDQQADAGRMCSGATCAAANSALEHERLFFGAVSNHKVNAAASTTQIAILQEGRGGGEVHTC